MHEIVAGLVAAFGLKCTILPMTNQALRTEIIGPDGEVPFQEYMVKHRTEIEVRDVAFRGGDDIEPAPGVLEALTDAEVVVIAPSNPIVSIGPILAVPGVRKALLHTSAVRAAISPIIAGEVVKGPAAKMLESLGHEVSALGVARLYRGLIDLMVIDEQDAALVPAIEALGMRCVATATLMSDDARKESLARDVLTAARQIQK